MRFSFGPFTLDAASRSLAFRGHIRQLSEKIFQVLLLLVQARGETVKKETFFDNVWPGEYVHEANLTQHVFMLRAILKEYDKDAAYVLTVSGRGYRLGAEVREDTKPASAPRSLPADESAALQLCCAGNQLLEKRSLPSIRLAERYFEEALTLHDRYRAAFIGLARAQALLGEYMYASPVEAFSNAKDLIARALAVDPQSADAYALQSELALFADWDFTVARETLNAAFALDPDSMLVCQNRVWLSVCSGDFDAALYQVRDAMQRAPFTLALLYLLGRVLVHRGEYRAARRSLASVLEIDPSFVLAKEWLALSLLFEGRPDACLLQLNTSRDKNARDLSYLEGRALAETGEKTAARSLLSGMCTHGRESYVPSWYLACIEAGLGMKSEATEHLEIATSSREIPALFSRMLPMFTSL